jgi:hypothetical protein
MLFKILKLFGLDVPAKITAARSELEQRIEEVTDYAKQATLPPRYCFSLLTPGSGFGPIRRKVEDNGAGKRRRCCAACGQSNPTR